MWSALVSVSNAAEIKMEPIAILPAPPSALLLDGQDRLVVVFTGNAGLGVLQNGKVEIVAGGPVSSAVASAQGGVYFASQGHLLHADLSATNTDMAAEFGGQVPSDGRVVETPDRSLWIEGAQKRRAADGSLHAVPEGGVLTPIPLTTDIFNNAWTVTARPAGGTQVMVLAANEPQRWQAVPLSDEDAAVEWSYIFADQVGYIWLGGPEGLRRFNPRKADDAWQQIGAEAVTALGASPAGLALVAYASGELVEIDIDAEGNALANVLSVAPSPVRCTQVDDKGGIWAATATQLFYYSPAPDAWQQSWRQLGSLPGGNHDIFSVVVEGKIYTAGGLTAGWGYPWQTHVFDELFAYEPEYDRWTVVSHMPFARCYNGLAVFDGDIWVVGGSANLDEPENPEGKRLPLDSAYFYDMENDAWIEGPSLNIARNEPTVLAAAGRLYAIGGVSPDGPVASVESIGPGEKAWRFEEPMPVPFNQAAGCVLGGLLYCINKEGFWAYDPATGVWDSELAQLDPSPQASLLTVYEDEIWVMGGSRLKASHRYNPKAKVWLVAPDLPTDQSWGAASALGGDLIVTGGAHWSEVHQKYIYENRTFALKKDVLGSRE
ncbi:MAG: N-acetylneuraminic acid mutarotase [Planctomycetota bacterium]|jgi:N-acetylneuraminic acid mutarotase